MGLIIKVYLGYVYRRRRRRPRRSLRRAILPCVLLLLVVLFIIDNAGNAKERRINEAQIISTECKKAVIRGADRETLSALSDILINQLGKPYVYGAAGPDSFDCSGLIQYAYGKLGITLPRVVAKQAKTGSVVQNGKLKFGDIVFFSGDGDTLTHAGIYIGSGYFLHSPRTGENVMLSNINSAYYSSIYKMAVRIL